MSAEADRIVRERLADEVALSYAYARLAVEAGKSAADLFAAANAHDAAHGATDTFVLAAFEAVETLSDLVVQAGVASAELAGTLDESGNEPSDDRPLIDPRARLRLKPRSAG